MGGADCQLGLTTACSLSVDVSKKSARMIVIGWIFHT